MQVGLFLSNISTPLVISEMIISFDLRNAVFNSSVHSNLLRGLSSFLKGHMILAVVQEYETWLTRPYHDLMSVIVFGVGNSLIASKNSRTRAYSVLRYLKAGKLNQLFAEDKFIWIKCYAVTPTQIKPLYCLMK